MSSRNRTSEWDVFRTLATRRLLIAIIVALAIGSCIFFDRQAPSEPALRPTASHPIAKIPPIEFDHRLGMMPVTGDGYQRDSIVIDIGPSPLYVGGFICFPRTTVWNARRWAIQEELDEEYGTEPADWVVHEGELPDDSIVY